MRRRFNSRERQALAIASGGRCACCGVELQPGWHADHVVPYSLGGETDIANADPLCPRCNQKKGKKMQELRRWQRHALDVFDQQRRTDFLLVATPGAGKTRFAGEVGKMSLADRSAAQMVVVVPTEPLKFQWAEAMGELGIDLQPRWRNEDGVFPSDFRGVVITYQQVAAAPLLLRKLVAGKPTLGCFDEVHHCGDSLPYGRSIFEAFERASGRLLLSGTPFRSDNEAIPFVRYKDGVGQADFVYDYADALADGVCRPVYFPRLGGEIEWSSAEGETRRHTFDDEVNERTVRERLRAALKCTDWRADSEQWLPVILRQANAKLNELRGGSDGDPRAGGLVIAMDIDHARRIAKFMESFGVEPVVAASDEPDAADNIKKFAKSEEPWIVSVKMVSEGVDIRRLKLGVFATNCATELFFRQAIGRIVRSTDTNDERAFFYLPDDPRLRGHAEAIKNQREHILDRDEDEEATERAGLAPSSVDQLFSKFQPLTSRAENKGVTFDGENFTPSELAAAECLRGTREIYANLETALLAQLARDVGSMPPAAPGPYESAKVPKFRKVEELRGLSNQRALSVAGALKLDPRDVNLRLNEAIGVRHIAHASEDQLKKRIELANKWRKTRVGP